MWNCFGEDESFIHKSSEKWRKKEISRKEKDLNWAPFIFWWASERKMAGGELARAQFLLLFFTFCSCCISRCISIPSEVTLSPVTHSLLAFQLPCNPRRGGSLDGTAIEGAEKRDGGDGWWWPHSLWPCGLRVSVCVCCLRGALCVFFWRFFFFFFSLLSSFSFIRIRPARCVRRVRPVLLTEPTTSILHAEKGGNSRAAQHFSSQYYYISSPWLFLSKSGSLSLLLFLCPAAIECAGS